jgi:hypothetical protein
MPRKIKQLKKITGLDLSGKSLKEALDLFWNRKISWIELAPLLDMEGKDSLSMTPAERLHISQILRAYRMLKAQRPSYLTSDLTGVTLPMPSTLCYLLTIYRWSRGADKEQALKDNIDAVLSCKIKEPQIRLLAKQAKTQKNGSLEAKEPQRGEALSITTLEKSQGNAESLTAFEGAIKAFNYMIDTVLERNSYNHIRRLFSKQCLDLSTRLNCLGDKEYHELWKQRKEITL